MQRDLDLIRELLFAIEAKPGGYARGTPTIEGYTEEQVGYHVFLAHQAGLLVGVDQSNVVADSPMWAPLYLTWDGHDFIAAIRDDTLWAKAKNLVIKPAGGVAFSVLLAWVKREAQERLGLPAE